MVILINLAPRVISRDRGSTDRAAPAIALDDSED
jgi:hypothetical protein